MGVNLRELFEGALFYREAVKWISGYQRGEIGLACFWSGKHTGGCRCVPVRFYGACIVEYTDLCDLANIS